MSSCDSPLGAKAGLVWREGPGMEKVEREEGATRGEVRNPDCSSWWAIYKSRK